MKITIYELLGMVKDGKAPKKIKIDNDILTLSKTIKIQYKFENFYGQLNWDYYIENYRLDDEIEIIEQYTPKEEKKKTLEEEFEEYNKNKKIDKISLHFDENLSEFLATTSINALDYEVICQGDFEKLLIDKINEIIEHIEALEGEE